MKDLQTVLSALEQWTDETPRCDLGALDAKIYEAIAIVRKMMQAEPVGKVETCATLYKNSRYSILSFTNAPIPIDTPLYLHPAPQAVPAGFVMVPVEPTPEMVLAGRELFGGFVEDTGGDYTRIHKAMLAAAPKGAV